MVIVAQAQCKLMFSLTLACRAVAVFSFCTVAVRGKYGEWQSNIMYFVGQLEKVHGHGSIHIGSRDKIWVSIRFRFWTTRQKMNIPTANSLAHQYNQSPMAMRSSVYVY